MRCLVATGYINFRMRAMVVSFSLLIFGKIGESCIFSKTILTEPGIHYPQIQMQSERASIQFGFIVQLKTQKIMILKACLSKKWLPELADIPVNLIHEPEIKPH
jgi:deoxyribodipyrimidine photo-lyase